MNLFIQGLVTSCNGSYYFKMFLLYELTTKEPNEQRRRENTRSLNRKIEVGEKVHAKCAHLHNKMMGLVELASFKRGESTFSSGSIGD